MYMCHYYIIAYVNKPWSHQELQSHQVKRSERILWRTWALVLPSFHIASYLMIQLEVEVPIQNFTYSQCTKFTMNLSIAAIQVDSTTLIFSNSHMYIPVLHHKFRVGISITIKITWQYCQPTTMENVGIHNYTYHNKLF